MLDDVALHLKGFLYFFQLLFIIHAPQSRLNVATVVVLVVDVVVVVAIVFCCSCRRPLRAASAVVAHRHFFLTTTPALVWPLPFAAQLEKSLSEWH